MKCALCEQELDRGSPRTVRFSNTQPARTVHATMAGTIVALGSGIAATLRAARGVPERTYWFHEDCWDRFSADLLVSGDG